MGRSPIVPSHWQVRTMDVLISSTGVRLDPQRPTRVVLHRGIGIRVNGEHLQGRAVVTVPHYLALDLIGTGRAHYPEPGDEEPVVSTPVSRDPVVESRDPKPKKR